MKVCSEIIIVLTVKYFLLLLTYPCGPTYLLYPQKDKISTLKKISLKNSRKNFHPKKTLFNFKIFQKFCRKKSYFQPIIFFLISLQPNNPIVSCPPPFTVFRFITWLIRGIPSYNNNNFTREKSYRFNHISSKYYF